MDRVDIKDGERPARQTKRTFDTHCFGTYKSYNQQIVFHTGGRVMICCLNSCLCWKNELPPKCPRCVSGASGTDYVGEILDQLSLRDNSNQNCCGTGAVLAAATVLESAAAAAHGATAPSNYAIRLTIHPTVRPSDRLSVRPSDCPSDDAGPSGPVWGHLFLRRSFCNLQGSSTRPRRLSDVLLKTHSPYRRFSTSRLLA